MKRTLPRLTALLVAGVLLQAPLHAQEAKPAAKAAGKPGVIATVNGVAIPTARADALLQSQLAQGQKDSEQMRAAVRNDLINREMLSQASKKKGFDKKPEVQAQFDAKNRELFDAADIVLETMVTGAAARTYNVLLAEERRVGAALIAVD